VGALVVADLAEQVGQAPVLAVLRRKGARVGLVVVWSSSGTSLTVFAAPPLQLILFLVLGAVTGILAGLRPARRAARQNMITAIAEA
jgi:ABC-type antimicrobial peptide transport system permease subunit